MGELTVLFSAYAAHSNSEVSYAYKAADRQMFLYLFIGSKLFDNEIRSVYCSLFFIPTNASILLISELLY